jgi:ribose transport system permease protein
MQQNLGRRLLHGLEVIPSIAWILIALLIIFCTIAPHFATVTNLFNLFRQGTVLTIVAAGMLIAIASGGIDLSVGALIGLTGTVIAFTMGKGLSWPLAMILGVLVCSLAGLVSGLIISKGHIFPFVVTFGMLFIAQSVALGLSNGGSIHIAGKSFGMIDGGYFLSLPIPFWVSLGAVLIVLVLMKRTTFGRYIFSVGSDATSAGWMGINVDLTRVLVYILSGTLAGIAGVVMASRVNTGNALIGQGTEFFAIASVVIGGTPITGGRGSWAGAILGSYVITVLQNGLTLMGLSSQLTSAIVGVTLMLGVIFAQLMYRGGSRGK